MGGDAVLSGVMQGRGAHGAVTHELESMFENDECDVGLAVGKVLMW